MKLRPETFAKLFAITIGLMGVYFLIFWLSKIIVRLPFPYPIEYLEDAIFFHALRIHDGQPLYINPNDGFAAIIYVPGYFYLLAGLFKIFGPSIITARVISLVCTLGIITLLLSMSVRKLKFPMSLVPISVYLSLLYAHFAGYQDLGRVDPLQVLMVLGGLFIIGDGKEGIRRTMIGIILLSLACYVKQPALAYLPFIYAFIIFKDRKSGIYATLASIILLALIFLIANLITHGWFGYYTLNAPMHHKLWWDKGKLILYGGFLKYPVRGILYFLLSSLIYFVFRLWGSRREPVNIFEAALPGAAIATIVPYMKEGGYFQDLLPFYTHLCFLLPFALSLKPIPEPNEPTTNGRMKVNPAIPLILIGLIFHCGHSIMPLKVDGAAVNPWTEFVPKQGNKLIGDYYVERIREVEGEIFMPSLGYYGWLAGREPGYVGVALTDLLGLDVKPEPLVEDVKSGRYTLICLPDYFRAEDYWGGQFSEFGYTGPTQMVPWPGKKFDLCPNIEIPPNNIYTYQAE